MTEVAKNYGVNEDRDRYLSRIADSAKDVEAAFVLVSKAVKVLPVGSGYHLEAAETAYRLKKLLEKCRRSAQKLEGD